jgi:hypothetical protein
MGQVVAAVQMAHKGSSVRLLPNAEAPIGNRKAANLYGSAFPSLTQFA